MSVSAPEFVYWNRIREEIQTLNSLMIRDIR